MANNYFRFKGFTVVQDKCAMKVSTDGVLLGAWADLHSANHVLDIGTGTGLIALMAAQQSSAKIHAIDVNKAACQQASENVMNSKWHQRITVQHVSLQNFSKEKRSFDAIISNPPFFKNSWKPAFASRTIARHDNTLPFNELLHGVDRLLQPHGKFFVILPIDRVNDLLHECNSKKLYCTKRLDVKPTPEKPVKRTLLQMEYRRIPQEYGILIIEQNGRHQYSEAYKQLTGNFYLT